MCKKGPVTLNLTTPFKRVRPRARSERDAGILWEDVATLVAAAILAWLIVQYVIQVGHVNQNSMHPTLEHGERILVNVLSPRYRLPERGEIIVFADPRGVEHFLIKRVVGLPRDRVEIRDGAVLVNDQPFPEAPTVQPHDEDRGPIVVPPGSLFVMGDNRPSSLDSRDFGPIPADSVRGFAVFRVWPLDRIGLLH